MLFEGMKKKYPMQSRLEGSRPQRNTLKFVLYPLLVLALGIFFTVWVTELKMESSDLEHKAVYSWD